MSELVEIGGGGAQLMGGRCTACGHVWFPYQSYGCERCGAAGEALVEASLSSDGVVEACATVHLHADPQRPAPFIVAAVRLDAGPLVRALADGAVHLAAGTLVTGHCEASDAGAERARSFRFVPVGEATIDQAAV